MGENFRFGHRAKGDTGLLRAQAASTTRVAQLGELDGEIVSSTHIRGLVAAGEVNVARALPRRPFQMRRTIVHGDKRGRALGFPTANLVPDQRAHESGPRRLRLPRAEIGAESFVGRSTSAFARRSRPGAELLVEAFLLDFSADVYGRSFGWTSSSACAASGASTIVGR